MLSKENRLRRMKDVRAVVRKGVVFPGQFFTVRATRKHTPPPRFTFIVSNKISKRAVVRNLIKRRLREIVRARKDFFRQDADYAFIAKPQSATASFAAFARDVDGVMLRMQPGTSVSNRGGGRASVPKKPLA